MTDEAVQLEIEDHVATVTLNQPERKNALSREIARGLLKAFSDIDSSEARCVVVRGAGGAFSAGGDLDVMRGRLESETVLHEEIRELERSTSAVIAEVASCRLPTVAEIDGPAIGAGANLAIACDLQLASEDARIGFSFRQVGLTVDSGTSYLLPRLVGDNVAKELVFTGELVGANRAKELGLVNHVFPADEFEDEVGAIVERIATGPTVAIHYAKRLIDSGREKSLDQAIADEALAQGIALDTRDHEEGVRAFLDGREPSFEGR